MGALRWHYPLATSNLNRRRANASHRRFTVKPSLPNLTGARSNSKERPRLSSLPARLSAPLQTRTSVIESATHESGIIVRGPARNLLKDGLRAQMAELGFSFRKGIFDRRLNDETTLWVALQVLNSKQSALGLFPRVGLLTSPESPPCAAQREPFPRFAGGTPDGSNLPGRSF